MTKTRRALLVAVSALLLVAISVGGTVAWLTATTDAVTNTFTPAGVVIDLEETIQSDNTTLEENETWSAKMVPGVTYPKNPAAKVTSTDANIYLFVKITDNTDGLVHYTVDSANWTVVEGVTNVWYRTVSANTTGSWDILLDDQVTIEAEDLTSQNMGTANHTLVFDAYAIQQAVGTPAQAWAALNPTAE